MVRLLLAAILAFGFVVSHVAYDEAAADFDGLVPSANLTGPSTTVVAQALAEPPLVPTPGELELFTLTNNDRARAGLASLSFDLDVLALARERGVAQKDGSTLSHYDASGQLAFVKLLTGNEVPYVRAGENLARVPLPQASAADRAEQALMQSPTHRANILQPEFDRIAIGEATDAAGRIVFVQLFRTAH